MSHPLKIYRARHDLSLEDMAALVRISPATLSRIENDKIRCSGVVAVAIEAKARELAALLRGRRVGQSAGDVVDRGFVFDELGFLVLGERLTPWQLVAIAAVMAASAGSAATTPAITAEPAPN